MTDFVVPCKDSGDFIVHCHEARPLLVLGNVDGDGRLRCISSCVSDTK